MRHRFLRAPLFLVTMSHPEASPEESLPAHSSDKHAPGWDVPEEGITTRRRSRFQFGGTTTGWALSDRFDRLLSPHKRYLGHSRRTFLIAIALVFIVLLGLIIGLSVGLTHRSKYEYVPVATKQYANNDRTHNLPLPNGAQKYTGDLTYYEPGLGACGVTSTSADDIVSISHYTFDAVQSGSNPNSNQLCGKKIRATRTKNGKNVSVDLTVVDRCQ